jgi:hypothetical protein
MDRDRFVDAVRRVAAKDRDGALSKSRITAFWKNSPHLQSARLEGDIIILNVGVLVCGKSDNAFCAA